MNQTKDNSQIVNKMLSGVVAGSLLVGGVVPVYQTVSEGIVLTAAAASDIAPKALQEGDRVAQSGHGLQLVKGNIDRNGTLKGKVDLTLEFKIVEGVKNNSQPRLTLRLQTKNLSDISWANSVSHSSGLLGGGVDLRTSNGVSVGEFKGGRFLFNDRVEDYVGSTITLNIQNVDFSQFLTEDSSAESMNDAVYWDVIINEPLMTSGRTIIGVIKEEGPLWFSTTPKNLSPQFANTLSFIGGAPQLRMLASPENNNTLRNILSKSNAPLTFRIEYNTDIFGEITPGTKMALWSRNTSYKPSHVKHQAGYVNRTQRIPGFSDTEGAVIKKIKDGVYEYTIDDPLKYGMGDTMTRVSSVYIPILDTSIIDFDNLSFKEVPKVTIYQNGQVVGGTEKNTSDNNYLYMSRRDDVSRGDADMVANTTYKDEKEVQKIPYETIRRDNPELPVGEERVVQQGVQGERTLIHSILHINGRPTSTKTLKSDRVTKQPVDHIIEVGVGVVSDDIKVDVVEIPYETERVNNPELPQGEERVTQTGQVGSKTITTTTPTMNGKPTGDPKVTEKVTKEPVKEIIEVGTGVVDQTIDIQTKTIPYETDIVYDTELPEGERVIDQAGVVGEKKITTTTPTLNGQPNGQPVIQEEVIKEPIKEIIRVGTGVVAEDVIQEVFDIPYETERVENSDLPQGEERVVQMGVLGSMTITTTTPTLNGQPNGEPVIQEEVEKEPITQIIEVGVGQVGEQVEVETEEVPYETERVSNHELPQGEERVVQEGVPGTLTITTTTPTLNDIPSGEPTINKEVTQEPVSEIIEVGTGIVGEDVSEVTEYIPFETEYIKNPDLPEGEENVIQEGSPGEKLFVTTTPTLNGVPSGSMKVKEEVIKEPVERIIEIGVGTPSADITEEKHDIPFETQYRENPDLPEGEEKVVQEGVPGELVIITTTPTLNGQPIGESSTEEKVIKEPTPQIIEVGIGSLSEDTQEEVVEIPFETEIIYDESLPEGEEVIEQEGELGELTIITITPTLNGQPSGESITTEKVTKEPVTEIKRVGKGVTSKEVTVEQKEIPFETKEIEDPNLPQGERVVEQHGVTGILTITTTTPTLNGQPSGESVVEEVVSKEAQDEIIRVGTGPVATPQSDNKPDDKPEPQQTQPEPDQKPDVKTGVEAVTTNPTLLATLVASITGLFAALGITIRRKKK